MKKIKYLAIGLGMQLVPVFALAQTSVKSYSRTLTMDSVLGILDRLLNWFAAILFFVGIFMILWAAFSYMTAGGDDTKIQTAKKRLIFGLVGIGIAILAFGIWGFIASFLGGGSTGGGWGGMMSW